MDKHSKTGMFVILLAAVLGAFLLLTQLLGQGGPLGNGPIGRLLGRENVELTLYFANSDASGVAPEKRTVLRKGEPLAELVIRELMAGPQSGLGRTIPDGTKLLSVEVKNGIAYVSFSQEFQDNHWGGSAGETMTLYSLANSLTELEGIKAVQLLIEGKKVESLAGHWSTDVPIERDESQIRPE